MRASLDRGWMLRRAPLWVALAFVILQFAGMSQEPPFNDTYRYGMLTLKILGTPEQQAHDESIRIICKRTALYNERERALDPVQSFAQPSQLDKNFADCVRGIPTPPAYSPNSPRYQAIFANRYGYPLLAAPLTALLGLERGMLLTSWLIGAAAGLVIFLLLRLFGAGRAMALGGQVLFYVLPVGYWSARTLAEGAMVLTTLLTIGGAWLLVQRRIVPGLAIVGGAQLLGFLVKFSQVTVLGLALLGAAAGIWLFDRPRRHRGTLLLAVTSAASLAASLAGPKLLGWPGFGESLQDTFTNHFVNPDVDQTGYRFAMLNKAYWTAFGQQQASHPLLLVATVVAAVALWRWHRSAALLVLAGGLTGIATEVAHPMWVEGDRLYTQVWVVAAIGLPLLWSLATGRRAAAGDTAVPQSPPEAGPDRTAATGDLVPAQGDR